MLVVQLREEAVTSSPLHGVPSMGPPNPEAVEEDREELLLRASDGAIG